MPLPLEVPTHEIPHMHMTHERARMDLAGITHLHQFFLPRQAQALGLLWRKAQAEAIRRCGGRCSSSRSRGSGGCRS